MVDEIRFVSNLSHLQVEGVQGGRHSLREVRHLLPITCEVRSPHVRPRLLASRAPPAAPPRHQLPGPGSGHEGGRGVMIWLLTFDKYVD